MIDFEEEIERFKPSLDVEAVEFAIFKSDHSRITEKKRNLQSTASLSSTVNP